MGNIVGVLTLAGALAALATYFWVQQARLGRARGASRIIALAMFVLAGTAAFDGGWSIRQYAAGLYGEATPRVDTALYAAYLIGLALVAYGLVRWIPMLRSLDEEARRRTRAEGELTRSLERMRAFNASMEAIAEEYGRGCCGTDWLIEAVLETLTGVLNVERASYWTLNQTQDELNCLRLLTVDGTGFESGMVIRRNDNPAYFGELCAGRTIVAADASGHPATAAFADGYLSLADVRSMMDAPLRAGPRVRGVICCESVGRSRDWTPDEVSIAAAAAQFIAMALLADDSTVLAEDARAAQAVAEKASAAKSEFLARMSHEIRTPLNGVLGMARLMSLEAQDPRTLERLQVVTRSGEMLLSLLNDVLDVSRIEAGAMRLSPERFDLRALIEEVRRLFTPMAHEKGLRITASIEPGSHADLVADAGRIRQCLINLVANAVKFTETGEVAVRASAHADGEGKAWVTLRVEDTGPGVPPDQLETIFAAFSQTDEGASRRHEGAGLGLTIVRRLARMMGGDARVENRAGGGAVFTVTLGADLPAEARKPAARSLPVDLAALAGCKVLIVDDNAVNLTVAEEFLRALGAETLKAASGEAALDLLRRESVDLCMLDVHMPGMDGLEVLRRIRAGETGRPRLPVLALTADAMPGDRERFLAAGMDGYLAKPVEFDTMAHETGRVLGKAGRAA